MYKEQMSLEIGWHLTLVTGLEIVAERMLYKRLEVNCEHKMELKNRCLQVTEKLPWNWKKDFQEANVKQWTQDYLNVAIWHFTQGNAQNCSSWLLYHMSITVLAFALHGVYLSQTLTSFQEYSWACNYTIISWHIIEKETDVSQKMCIRDRQW